MTNTCKCCAATSAVLDVRDLAPRLRHPRIFETFEALAPGDAFVLVNDHDPKPLYYQFAAERAGAFEWRYVELGPETWRVEIRRCADAGIGPESTVDAVARRSPEALEALKRLGVNHCCGGHLTLREAAASAGVSLDTLLGELGQSLATRR